MLPLLTLCSQHSITPSFSEQGLEPHMPAWGQPNTYRHLGPPHDPSALLPMRGNGEKTPCVGIWKGCLAGGRSDPIYHDCLCMTVLCAGTGQPTWSTLPMYGNHPNHSPVLSVHAALMGQGDPGTRSVQSHWVKRAQQNLLYHQRGKPILEIPAQENCLKRHPCFPL